MKTVGAYEAKTHLSQLLDEVAKGETITITRHRMPVARLVPASAGRRVDAAAAVDALLKWREEQGLTLGGISIRELIEEGRRW
ncbi:MAG: type II toxin-antitoxin system prevent-host-death family antitoxin [Chloroflexi bacterium]|nr:type II toxin-antitoxin system prevent-host-death family antitoxin [Chloroflexota bacterium]